MKKNLLYLNSKWESTLTIIPDPINHEDKDAVQPNPDL